MRKGDGGQSNDQKSGKTSETEGRKKKRGRVKDRRKRDINKGETRRIKVTIEVKNEWKGMNYVVGTKVERKIRKEW